MFKHTNISLLCKTTCCICAVEIKEEDVVLADPWNDGKDSNFCSAECAEHAYEQHQEYLDSYEV